MATKKTEQGEALFATTAHIAGDIGLSPEEQIDATVRAGFPEFDPARHAVAIADAGAHPEDAGARLVRVVVTAAPPAPTE